MGRKKGATPIFKLGALLKQHFFAGILVLIPLGVIAWIFSWAFGVFAALLELLPDSLRPETFLADPTGIRFANVLIIFIFCVIAAMAVSLLGWASKNYFGRKVLEFVGEIIQRIPVIRSVYSALDQLLKTFTAGGGQQFNRVVYVEYPRKECWTLAFVTGPAKNAALPPHHLNLYVPTTPNPTSGFYLIVAESEVRDSHLSVEEAFKTILSLGIAHGG